VHAFLQAVLYGSLTGMKSRYRNNSAFLDGHVSPQEMLSALINKGVKVDCFEVSTPSLNEIFIRVVKEAR
jgi:prepilin-type processing-associated H-X9-DG protein